VEKDDSVEILAIGTLLGLLLGLLRNSICRLLKLMFRRRFHEPATAALQT
jgi:hypothetical protein